MLVGAGRKALAHLGQTQKYWPEPFLYIVRCVQEPLLTTVPMCRCVCAHINTHLHMALAISKTASGLVLANTCNFVCFLTKRRLQPCSVAAGSSTALFHLPS